jgi:hypothetical protein
LRRGGIEIELIEGLACDGAWSWRATRRGAKAITVQLVDENHQRTRTSCASMVHQKVTVTVGAGSYQVHVALPAGYGTLDRQITVGG